MSQARILTGGQRFVLLSLFLLSGTAALIYEVLWLKELGTLFGVTAYAAATTLAVFFLGLGVGGLVWGRLAPGMGRPLRVWALLEFGIAASALLYFGLLSLYRGIYPHLFEALGDRPGLLLLVKFSLSVLVLFPPALFMGGTLPTMGQFLVRNASELGRTASLLYLVNTLGAAIGALAAGFFLPAAFGFRVSYQIAIGLNLAIGVLAFALETRLQLRSASAPPLEDSGARKRLEKPASPYDVTPILVIAAASGFLTLGLEVLWTRMFAQTLQNSVYTFAAILTLFLLVLAIGSGVAHLLSRSNLNPTRSLVWLLLMSSLAVGVTPFLFYWQSAGLGYFGAGKGWSGYLAEIFGAITLVLFVPGVLIGSVFPHLMKLSEGRMTAAGKTIGVLAGVNTLAAIAGSLTAGFVLLGTLGLWRSIQLVALCYFGLAVAALRWGRLPVRGKTVAAFGVVGLALVLAPYSSLQLIALDEESGEQLVELREVVDGSVAIVRRGDDLRLKVNNHYHLGGSAAKLNQQIQAWLPLSLHPSPRSVFFLGLGTGISAGGALDFPVDRVVVTELISEIVALDRNHFGPYANGLFEDSRVRILAEDGRNFLAGSRETFDVIIGDIFLTYRIGVGSLYTREHFENVRARLNPGGLFAQWLPMFDLTEQEFGLIARTMSEVFPQVTLWRRGFSPRYPVFALIATASIEPLDLTGWKRRVGELIDQSDLEAEMWLGRMPLAAYVGNISSDADRYRAYPVITDDRRQLEYLSPITERESRGAGRIETLAWLRLVDFSEALRDRVPRSHDPYLRALGSSDWEVIDAGLEVSRWETLRRLGHTEAAEAARRRFESLLSRVERPPDQEDMRSSD